MAAKEVCSCGAALEIAGAEPPYRWSDQWERYMSTIRDWRENHRHEEADTPKEGAR